MMKYRTVAGTRWWDEALTQQRCERLPCGHEFSQFLLQQAISLLVCSKQDACVFMISATGRDGECEIASVSVPEAMGLAVSEGNLVIGAGRELRLWRDLTSANPHISVFVPTVSHAIGRCSVHDVAFHPLNGKIIFLNTLFSSVSGLDECAAFRQIWRPGFIKEEGPVDCAHLNGLALGCGGEMIVTMLSTTGNAMGWRNQSIDAGVLYDACTDTPLLEGLCLPHSPVFFGKSLWFLESGKGRLLRITEPGAASEIAVLPGLTRGLALCQGMAFVGISRLRQSSVATFELLNRRFGSRLACEISLLDAVTGRVTGGLKLPSISEISSLHIYPKPKVRLLEPNGKNRDEMYIFSEEK